MVTFAFLHYQKKQVKRTIKHEIIAGIDKDELVLLKIPTAESETLLEWEHAKEFEYQHEMYDVVSLERKGDTTYYWCWWDNEETQLNKRLDALLTGNLSHDKQHQQQKDRLLSFFKTLYHNQAQVVSFGASDEATLGITTPQHYTSPFFTPPAPPPDWC